MELLDLFGETSLLLLFLLFCAGTMSGFVDSIVGGGGLISVPAMMLTGLPPAMALGSNKCSSVFGALAASINFYRSGHVNMGLLRRLLPFTVLGAVFGTLLAVALPPLYLKPIIIGLLILVAIVVFFRKEWGEVDRYEADSRSKFYIALGFALAIGLYDGFVGPGTGTFLIFAFIFIGFDFVKAAGNAKILNLASNVVSLIIFIVLGQVNFLYGGVTAIGQFCGAYLGSGLAIRKGSQLVRTVFLLTTSVMIGKMIWDYIQLYL